MKKLTIILLLSVISLQITDMLLDSRRKFTCNYDVATRSAIQESIDILLESDSLFHNDIIRLDSKISLNANNINHNTSCDISRAKDLLVAQDAIILLLKRSR